MNKSATLETEGKSNWLVGLRMRVNALPVWRFWLMFFVVTFCSEETFRFFFKGTSLSDSIREAALWASAFSFVHWLTRK